MEIIYNLNMPLDINYHHLYYFWVCVRCGSMTAASRELKLSQSALSLQLKSLEKSLGRRLLARSRSGVTPTAEGREVFERCERIFPEGEALSRAVRSNTPRAPIQFRVGVGSGLAQETVLAVLDRISGVERLIPIVQTGPGELLAERLARHQVDVALFSGNYAGDLGPGFRSLKVDSVPMRLVCTREVSARYAPFGRAAVEYPMLLRPSGHPVRERLDAWMRERGMGVLTVAESSSAELLHELALRGRGIAALSLPSVLRDLETGRLVKLAGGPSDLVNEIWAAAPARAHADPEPRRATELLMVSGPLFPRAGATSARARPRADRPKEGRPR
jgi:LysR family transcriptional activator of nhaA